MTGVRARLSIADPPNCPVVADLPAGTTASDVRWTGAGDRVVEQYASSASVDDEPVFEADGDGVYRIERERSETCACDVIESLGHPVTDVSASTEPDRLAVTLLLPSPEPLVEVIAALEELGTAVKLECLVRGEGGDDADPVVVDRGRLTDRQREVLEVAHGLGYFAYPREASADEVAAELGIVRSTFAEHLAAAQRRLLADVLEVGDR